jgi:hypothetical protein
MTAVLDPEQTQAPARAALYFRVSTGRQAASDLSIPDQRRQALAYCAARGWDVAGLMERQAAKNEDHTARLTALRAKISDAESRLGRLYAAIESGVADLNAQTFKDRVAAVKTERDLAQIAHDRAVVETNPRARITDEKIAKFVETMRSNVLTGDTPFRRAYIRSVIDQVEVDDDEIRIWAVRASSNGSSPPAAVAIRPGCPVLFGSGAPHRIRTCGLCLRRIKVKGFREFANPRHCTI